MKINEMAKLADIANALNVSKTCVSRALRDMPDISKEMKIKVRNKAKELGYVPNNLAPYFKNGKSNIIAIVYRDLLNPYFSLVVGKLSEKIKKEGFSVVVELNDDPFLNEEIMLSILKIRVSGIISFLEPDQKAVELSQKTNTPILLYGRESSFDEVSSIYTDDFDGERQVGEYLKNNSYKKVAYLGPDYLNMSLLRKKGLDAGYGSETDFIRLSNSDGNNIKDKLKGINLKQYDALVFSYDNLAYYAKNLSLMEEIDLSSCDIFGYDGLYSHNVCLYEISSVVPPFEEMISDSCSLIISLANNKVKPIKKIYPVKLHIVKSKISERK